MLEKLYILGFFFLIYCLRYHLVWARCFKREKNQYINLNRLNHQPEKDEDEMIKAFCLVVVLVFYLFKAEFPSILDIIIGFSIVIVGASYSSVARIHLNGSWANMEEVTKDYKPLVTTGVYSRVRNPIYVGLIIQSIGYGFSMGIMSWQIEMMIPALTYFGFAVGNYHSEIIAEEKFLAKRHGDKFKNYCLHTGRYIPKIIAVKPITKMCTEIQ
ncbi:MAG: methyltransferase family protein [Candidatus Komeilibacteria bacterium]